MQTAVNKNHNAKRHAKDLSELRRGETGIIHQLDLPEDDARRLMEMGFIPGHSVTTAHAAPGRSITASVQANRNPRNGPKAARI